MKKISEQIDDLLWHLPLISIAGVAVFLLCTMYTLSIKHKYTIKAQGNTYKVDTFRVYGGQLNFDEGDKNIIVKGNYIIEINR